MSSLVRRDAWVIPARPVTGPKSNLSKIDQIVIHYPGVDPGALPLDNPVMILRNTNEFYWRKKPTGYAIGYSFATFPSGRFELRGFDIQNAANKGHNDHTLSINCMVNGADEMPQIQLEYTRDMIAEIWDRLGRQVPLIAHGRLSGAATACPGAGIKRQLDAGLLLPLVEKPRPETPEVPEVPRPQPQPDPIQEDDDMHLGLFHINDVSDGTVMVGYCDANGDNALVLEHCSPRRYGLVEQSPKCVKVTKYGRVHMGAITCLGPVPPSMKATDFDRVVPS